MTDKINLRRRSKLKPPDRYAPSTFWTDKEKELDNLLKSSKKKSKKAVKENGKIPIDYGARTPRIDVNRRPQVALDPLPVNVENSIKEGHCSFKLQDGEISPKQSDNFLKPKWIQFVIIAALIVLIAALIFIVFFLFLEPDLIGSKNLGNSLTFLKISKPSSELAVLLRKDPQKKANTQAKLKSNEMKKQKLRRSLFIEQECSNTNKDDFLYDYALKSNGARILSTVDTEPYGENYIVIKSLGMKLGPLPNFIFPQQSYDSSGPTALLEGPIKIPGQCWAFKGSRGRVRIQLAKSIIIKTVAVEQFSGNLNSAPRFFSIMGIDTMENQQEIRTHLGTFEFEKSGRPIQFFKLTSDEASFPFRIIEFHVTANHGNKDFTCVYRLRVYGNV